MTLRFFPQLASSLLTPKRQFSNTILLTTNTTTHIPTTPNNQTTKRNKSSLQTQFPTTKQKHQQQQQQQQQTKKYYSSRYTKLQNITKETKHEVYSWGMNEKGQCGLQNEDNPIDEPSLVSQVSNVNKIVAVSAGWTSSFVVTDSNQIFSWGYGAMGSLSLPQIGGDGPVLSPTEILPLKNTGVVQVASGRYHTLFLTKDKNILCVGSSEFGQLGNGLIGENAHSRMPVKIEGFQNKNIVSISSGLDHCVALSNQGKVWGWGYNVDGQLGLGHDDEVPIPEQMKALTDYHIIRADCGLDHTAFLTSEGQLFVVGNNEMGQLGLGNKESVFIPHIVNEGALTNKRVVDFACAGFHMIALSDRQEVFAWGNGSDGRLGCGTTDDHLTPIKVEELSDKGITRLFAGGGQSFAVNDHDTKIWTWGLGQNGRLGLGKEVTDFVTTPTLLDWPQLRGKPIISLAPGLDHTLLVVQADLE